MLDRSDEVQVADPPREISEADLEKLKCGIQVPREWLDLLEQHGPLPAKMDDGRRFPRFHYRVRGVLEHRQTLPALPRSPERFVVLTKDVSRKGVAFLHETQLFPTERANLWVPSGKATEIEIQRCTWINERCYEVGAVFV